MLLMMGMPSHWDHGMTASPDGGAATRAGGPKGAMTPAIATIASRRDASMTVLIN
jgi:hypothetical protein